MRLSCLSKRRIGVLVSKITVRYNAKQQLKQNIMPPSKSSQMIVWNNIVINYLFWIFVEVNWAASWQNQQCGCGPSEDSEQPGHSPSLFRVFAVRMEKAWVLSYPLGAQGRLWSDWRMPRLIWVFAGRTLTLLVLSWGGSIKPRLPVALWIGHIRTS